MECKMSFWYMKDKQIQPNGNPQLQKLRAVSAEQSDGTRETEHQLSASRSDLWSFSITPLSAAAKACARI